MDKEANCARLLPCPHSSFMPPAHQRFVFTMDGRMLSGNIAEGLRRLGQMMAVGRTIEDVKSFRTMASYSATKGECNDNLMAEESVEHEESMEVE